MKEKGWKSQLVIVSYSLLPLPTTPLFVAAGIAKLKPPLTLVGEEHQQGRIEKVLSKKAPHLRVVPIK